MKTLVSQLVSKCHLIPITINLMNNINTKFIPRKDYNQQRLISGYYFIFFSSRSRLKAMSEIFFQEPFDCREFTNFVL
jgi:hypothetical protein